MAFLSPMVTSSKALRGSEWVVRRDLRTVAPPSTRRSRYPSTIVMADEPTIHETNASFGYVGPEKMGIAFTCMRCDHRSVKKISRKAYQEGIVIIECAGCHGRHIIADNLGWYWELTQGKRNVEELAKAHNQSVTKITDEAVFQLESSLYAGKDPSADTTVVPKED